MQIEQSVRLSTGMNTLEKLIMPFHNFYVAAVELETMRNNILAALRQRISHLYECHAE